MIPYLYQVPVEHMLHPSSPQQNPSTNKVDRSIQVLHSAKLLPFRNSFSRTVSLKYMFEIDRVQDTQFEQSFESLDFRDSETNPRDMTRLGTSLSPEGDRPRIGRSTRELTVGPL